MNRLSTILALTVTFAKLCWAAPTLTIPTSPLPPWQSEGKAVWIKIPAGRMKIRVYASNDIGSHPVLAIFVHGDLFDARGGMYLISQTIAHETRNVIAASLLRPGYKDAEGDMSSGQMGYAVGDNYTAEVVDAVDMAVRALKDRYHASAVVLIGHSGGGAIAADLLGRHPQDVGAALLLACGCDPAGTFARFTKDQPDIPKNLRNHSLLPLDMVPKVSRGLHVRVVVGSNDQVARVQPSEAYAHALEGRGIDVKLVIVSGVGHNDVTRSPEALAAMADVLTLEGATIVPPDASSSRATRP